jgi:hypothetical protein
MFSSMQLLSPVLKQLASKEFRLRLNFYGGTHAEALKDLELFGLTKEHVDSVYLGAVHRYAYAEQWLKQRQAIET